MKLKDIENPIPMTLEELKTLFRKWFPNGISKEEGWILWSIFSNNNRYLFKPNNKIIETGTWRAFGGFLSGICNEKSDYMDYYMADYNLDYIDVEIIKKVHRIVNQEVEFVEDYWEKDEDKTFEE